jgi:hypothetical protein
VPVNIQLKDPTLLFSSDSPKKNFNLKHFPLEKENEQDPAVPKPVKGRSPVMTSTPKGPPFLKNFMAPTLLASFKAVGPSCQRKRVLGERNETVLNPLSDSSLPQLRSKKTPTAARSFVSSPQIKETTSLFALSPTIRVSPSTGPATTTQTGRLQSAHLPPYDPKVNCLSPRPQFLHYKPMPRGNLFGNGIVSEEKAQASFHMVHSKNKVSEEQIQYEIGKLEEEEEVEDKEEEEEEIEAGSISEQQEMAASSVLSETREDSTQPDMFEKSEPEKPKISEPELVENREVEDLETIESETLKPGLIEPESGNIFVGELINILKKTAQGMAAVAVLLSLATAVAASAFAKREQNQVPVCNSIHGDETPCLVHGSSESHAPNRISLQQ